MLITVDEEDRMSYGKQVLWRERVVCRANNFVCKVGKTIFDGYQTQTVLYSY